MIAVYLILVAILAVIALRSSTTEGWRPFAWYGYPGTSGAGSVGYQARGDWCGIVPATRTVDKPIPLIPAEKCGKGKRC